jgi:hypothetical protein
MRLLREATGIRERADEIVNALNDSPREDKPIGTIHQKTHERIRIDGLDKHTRQQMIKGIRCR